MYTSSDIEATDGAPNCVDDSVPKSNGAITCALKFKVKS